MIAVDAFNRVGQLYSNVSANCKSIRADTIAIIKAIPRSCIFTEYK